MYKTSAEQGRVGVFGAVAPVITFVPLVLNMNAGILPRNMLRAQSFWFHLCALCDLCNQLLVKDEIERVLGIPIIGINLQRRAEIFQSRVDIAIAVTRPTTPEVRFF